MDYCNYYQATIDKKMTWFFTGCLRACEHVAFDRTYNVDKGIFEFFVPVDMEPQFLNFMQYFVKEGIATDFSKKQNRLCHEVV